MSRLTIREVRPGDAVDAAAYNALVRELREQRLTAGPGLRAVTTPAGTTVSAASAPAPASGGGGATGARVVSVAARSGLSYTATDALSGESVEIALPVYAQVNDIPAGTRLVALDMSADSTGGWTA